MQVIPKLKIEPILIACGVFTVLFYAVTWQNSVLAPMTGDHLLILWMNLSPFLVYLSSGFIGARLAQTLGAVHGLAIGVLATLVVVLFYSFQAHQLYAGFTEHWVRWLVVSVLACGSGGALWDLFVFLRKRIRFEGG